MEFETVISNGPSTALKNLAEGESLTGKLLDILVEDNSYGSKNFNFLMELDSGEKKVLTDGTAKYVGMDIAHSQKKFQLEADKVDAERIEKASKLLGRVIRITKTGSYLNKTKKTINTYTFQAAKAE